MKKILIAFVGFCLAIYPLLGQSANQQGLVKFFPVSSDQMKFAQTGYVPDQNIFWVETDESFGEVVLNFNGISHPKLPSSANLIINVPLVTDAQSNTGVLVYIDNQLIGKAIQSSSNSNLKINLDIEAIKGKNQFTLLLKGGGNDGLAIYSKASGYEAFVEFVY